VYVRHEGLQDRLLNRLGRDSSSSVVALILPLDFSLNLRRNNTWRLRVPLNVRQKLKTEKNDSGRSSALLTMPCNE
jgi:hypothetical protein